MKIIIPMAGAGKRMRPHTLTTPKPLIPLIGKPMVLHIVEELAAMSKEKIEEIAFVIGDFGKEVEQNLVSIANGIGANGSIYHQLEPLGTAHAIYCAKESLSGPVIVAFADTLFKTDFHLDIKQDGYIWVKRVDNWQQFGVVKLDEQNMISDFIEKPSTFISDLAIIGIYFFRDGDYLKKEIEFLLENNIKDKGEFQLTSALENMKNKGTRFIPAPVTEWLDCGNKDATVVTHARVLEFSKEKNMVHSSAQIVNSKIIQPSYVAEGASIINSEVGPYVSIGNQTKVEDSVISNSIVQNNSFIKNKTIRNSMIGSYVTLNGNSEEWSIGDYSTQG